MKAREQIAGLVLLAAAAAFGSWVGDPLLSVAIVLGAGIGIVELAAWMEKQQRGPWG